MTMRRILTGLAVLLLTGIVLAVAALLSTQTAWFRVPHDNAIVAAGMARYGFTGALRGS
jgi:hypothetical protein